jgi:hypothetical protein
MKYLKTSESPTTWTIYTLWISIPSLSTHAQHEWPWLHRRCSTCSPTHPTHHSIPHSTLLITCVLFLQCTIAVGNGCTLFTNCQILNVQKLGLGNTEFEEWARGNIVYIVTDRYVKMCGAPSYWKLMVPMLKSCISGIVRFLESQRLKTRWDEICCGECWKT